MRVALIGAASMWLACASSAQKVSDHFSDSFMWRRVPGGMVLMGSDPGSVGHDADEQPRLEAKLEPFEMLVTPLTVEQWAQLANAVRKLDPSAAWHDEPSTPEAWEGRCTFGAPMKQNHPMTCVDHRAARAACRVLGGDLPTEAQREHAARAGTTTPYFWGDAFDPTHVISSVTCATRGCLGSSAPVVTDGPRCNAFGLCDLAGNVWEWTSSTYQESLGESARVASKDPVERPVMRGGSWLNERPELFRVSQRGLLYPNHGLAEVGVRCIRR